MTFLPNYFLTNLNHNCKMTNFKFIPLITVLSLIISCSGDDDPVIEYVTITETVTETETVEVEVDEYADSTLEGNITSDKTLDASKVWL